MSNARELRILVAAFGDAGHAFPAVALARTLKARGHRVVVETWEQWREQVTGEGLEFAAAQEYRAFAGVFEPEDSVPTIAAATRALEPLLDELQPDIVVSDILTSAPALAAELAEVPRATLIPHVYPVGEPGLPFFGFGARPPRTGVGRAIWRRGAAFFEIGLDRGLREANETRAELGLPPAVHHHAGISDDLALVATFPQLEYPRRWPRSVTVTGPMFFEMPYPDVELPPGSGPLVVVAPSTSKDERLELIRATLEGLAEEPVRVLATTNLRGAGGPDVDVPGNASVVPWASYSQVMGAADLVICHGGHGTVARALACGTPVLSCGSAGDMAENGARVAWSGAGLALPRRVARPGPVRWAVRRILGDAAFRESAGAIAAWSERNDGAVRGAELVEELASRKR